MAFVSSPVSWLQQFSDVVIGERSQVGLDHAVDGHAVELGQGQQHGDVRLCLSSLPSIIAGSA